jgi:hypothetical protein
MKKSDRLRHSMSAFLLIERAFAPQGRSAEWVCPCSRDEALPTSRQRPTWFCCDFNGDRVEPDGGWGGLLRCKRCARMIEMHHGWVVARPNRKGE